MHRLVVARISLWRETATILSTRTLGIHTLPLGLLPLLRPLLLIVIPEARDLLQSRRVDSLVLLGLLDGPLLVVLLGIPHLDPLGTLHAGSQHLGVLLVDLSVVHLGLLAWANPVVEGRLGHHLGILVVGDELLTRLVHVVGLESGLLGLLGGLEVRKELVLEAARDRGAHLGVLHEHGAEEVDARLGVEREALDVKVDVACRVQIDDLLFVLTIKRRLSIQKEIEDDPETEHVALLIIPLVILQVDNLGRHKPGSPAPREQLLLLLHERGQTIVNQAVARHIVFRLVDDVLGLQIPMHDALHVEVLKAQKDVVDDLLDLRLLLEVLVLKLREKLLALKDLDDEIDRVLGLVDLVERHVVSRVGDGLHDGDLFV